ncbi:uncharacterized protein BXZ73DRAFT_103289 [Epithele typhae]|uniref:uncharacterized protein n=1 Tax=Epithele typhae TaxID=378194 RepID=UPI0020074197|nr:uncharacterized protein BXZ73DRAFT_103289 [Epithele typhae]KAH9925409.1 hypothetical protein BXZ73DRAFT_103289 [Epithele typhae]
MSAPVSDPTSNSSATTTDSPTQGPSSSPGSLHFLGHPAVRHYHHLLHHTHHRHYHHISLLHHHHHHTSYRHYHHLCEHKPHVADHHRVQHWYQLNNLTPPSSTQSSTTSFSTSTQTSTFIGTNAQGSTFTSLVTQTVTSASTSPVDSSQNNETSSSSHTGAIIGGVVGGVAALALIGALLWFFLKRRQRDDFDGNFDPDRVVGLSGDNHGTLPDIDLAAENITPYSYSPHGAGPGTPVPTHPPSMSQYGPSAFAGGLAAGAAGAAMGDHRSASPPSAYSQSGQTQSRYSHGPGSDSQHGYPDYSAYATYANAPSTAHSHTGSTSPTNPSVGGIPNRDFRHPSPGASVSYAGTDSGSSSGPGMIPSAKEREAAAYRRGQNLAVSNPDHGANTSAQGSGVMQHVDGGRLHATPEDDEPAEVPPRYDTIPRDK